MSNAIYLIDKGTVLASDAAWPRMVLAIPHGASEGGGEETKRERG